MEYNFANRMLALKPSAIREILKMTSQPGIISFAAGNPSAETFPVKEFNVLAMELLADEKKAAAVLQYGVSEGLDKLRIATAKRLREKYDTGTDNDQIIITSGGQQVVDLFSKAMINPGDTIITEAPSFIGSLNTFRTYEANLVSVEMEPDGMNLQILEKHLKTEKNVKFIYCISTFQNPTGYTTSLEKRKGILALAKKYNVMILEDSPYFELRYSGEHVAHIKSMDTDGRVMYAGSFSKILSPGIRLGFAIGNNDMIAKMVIGKQATDVHSNQFFQAIAAEYVTRFDLDEHICEVQKLYREKRDFMLACFDKYLPKSVQYSRPDGGLFIWINLPNDIDGSTLAKLTVERKLAVVPGCSFMVDDTLPCSAIRVNFSMPTMEQIEAGSKILGECITTIVR